MHRVIAGGTGLIGKRLVEHWLKQNHTITVVGRSQQQIEKMFSTRVQAITWDQLTRDVLASAEVVVNLAGSSVGDKRWSEARKQEILDSRINTTKKIAGLLAELGHDSPPLLNASAVGIYGLQQQLSDRLPPQLDESAEIDWNHPPDFLSLVARRWEKAAEPAIAKGVRVLFLRFGVVLAKEGGALPQIVKPFQLYLGGRIATGNQPFSWIAIDDVIRAIDFLLTKRDLSGPFNIVAPECVPERMLAETIGKVIHRPSMIRTPAFALKWMLGEQMAQELLLEGQHVYPKRLLDLEFNFSYPEIEPALMHNLQ
jgi:uncharacterized protein